MSDNIKVAVRVRPLIKREIANNLAIQWVVEGNNITQINPETKKKCETEYTFDLIFTESATNIEVFNGTVKPIVEAAMQGFNGTIFSYGQTSSGKTYTMMGTNNEPGVTPLTVASIFEYIKKDQTREYVLSVSYLELYNEKINDLLDTERKDLKVREENGEIKVDCKEEVTHSVDDILRCMKKGDKNRSIGETNMNERSSRSHTIFKISISSVLKTNADGDATVAQLNLIDLAGSERMRTTGATGERFNEGRHINLSLSILGLVIKQLSENQAKSKLHKHISYRDSKLTRILQPSLGGNSLTTIICAVTPAAGDETACTLAFAQRAKGIKNKPQVNETGSDSALVKKFHKRIAQLNQNLIDANNKIAATEEEKQHALQVLKGRIELLQTKILSGAMVNEQNQQKSQVNRRRTWAGQIITNSPPSASFLPVIPEGIDEIDREDEKEFIKRRQSVFRSVKLVDPDESFSADLEDFELQLIKDEQERMTRWSTDSEDSGNIMNKKVTKSRHVRFKEDVDVDIDDEFTNFKSIAVQTTPEKQPSISSPGTPKATLRQNLCTLRSEFQQLQEFTTLEKQLHLETPAPQPPDVEFIKKSLEDTEQICKDISKKYAELQSEHNLLKNRYEETVIESKDLKEQVKLLTAASSHLPSVEAEKNRYKTKFTETQKRLQILEDETSSHAYALELITVKHKSREKELETSLNSAWTELNLLKANGKPADSNEITTIQRLQAEISDLTQKLTSFESKIEEKTKENEEFQANHDKLITEFSEKIQNYQKLLAEKELKLTETVEFSSKCPQDLKANQEIIRKLEKEVEELQIEVQTKDSEVSDLKSQLSIENEVKSTDNDQLATKNAEIERLEVILDEKAKEVSSLTENLADLKEKLKKLENQKMNSLELLENKLQENSQELEICSQNFIKQIQDLEAELSVLKSTRSPEAIESLEKKLQETSQELEFSAKRLEIELKSQESLQSQISRLEQSLESARDSQSLLEKEKSQLQLEIDDLRMTKPQENPPRHPRITRSFCQPISNQNLTQSSIMDDPTQESTILDNFTYFDSTLDVSIAPTDSVFSNMSLNQLSSSVLDQKQASSADLNRDQASHSALDERLASQTRLKRPSSAVLDHNQTLEMPLEQSILQDSQLQSKEPADLVSIIKSLDSANRRLLKEFQMKIRETDDIKNDVGAFKVAVQNLQQTVLLLTNENAELTLKLTSEKEQIDEIKCSFEKQLKNLLEEKKNLETINKTLNNSIDHNSSSLMEFTITSEDVRAKVEALTSENHQLSEDLMEKIDELEQLKKNLDIKHDRIKALELENVELSSDLMEKIDEYESFIKKLKENGAQIAEQAASVDKSTSTETSLDKCTKCAHLSELKKTERALKNEVKSANKKLMDLKEDFVQKSASVEKLQTKVKDLNISGILNDSMFNGSFLELPEEIDPVTYVEEKVQNLHSELESLKSNYDQLTVLYQEKCNQIDNLKDGEQNSSEVKLLRVSEEIQKHKEDLAKFKKYINNVSNALDKFKMEKSKLATELNAVKEEKAALEQEKATLDQEKLTLEQKIAEIHLNFTKESEKSAEALKIAEETLQNLRVELQSFKSEEQEKVSLISTLEAEISSLKEELNHEDRRKSIERNAAKADELNSVRYNITKEILALKTNAQLKETSSATDLFRTFISTIMTREQEIIQQNQSAHRREKRKLEEQTRQLADAEKRSAAWAKELEADVERLQNDVADRESRSSALEAEIERLKNLIKEADHEKKLLNEKVLVMEADFVTLQSDLEKYRKISSLDESKTLLRPEEVEKMLQDSIRSKTLEHSSKLHEVEEKYKLRVAELENSLECLKTKNFDLRNTIEGLEANDKNFKAIIDMKCSELEKSAGIVERLELELKTLNEVCNNLSEENVKNVEKIEEVTQLLKTKCDKLTEYKAQLESVTPDYEKLRDESLENKSRLEKYKTEMEFLRQENSKHLIALIEARDLLESEKINSIARNKQLAELMNKNLVIRDELEQLQTKYDALNEENDRLVRKVRNSTSKLTAERDVDDLKDENNTLRKNLEGAGNRITEMQAMKSQLASENGSLKAEISLLVSELAENKAKSLELQQKMSTLEGKLAKMADLEIKLTESHLKMAALEGKIAKMTELECKLTQLTGENEKFKAENKDLDDEMNDMLERMQMLERENTQYELELYKLKDQIDAHEKNGSLSETTEDLKELEQLRRDLEQYSLKCDLLAKENAELKSRTKDPSFESRSTSSSRSTSPTPSVSSRRKRRSDLFNQNRPQALAEELEVAGGSVCNCEAFRKKINELELELICKVGKITAMEMKIQSACVPYKKRCRDYAEEAAVLRQKSMEMKARIRTLEAQLFQVVDCEKCKKRQENRRDAEVQVNVEKTLGFAAPRSGIIETERQILKMKKTNNTLIDLCNSRLAKIKDLSKECEKLKQQFQLCTCGNFQLSNPEDSKENVPSNIQPKPSTSKLFQASD